VSGGRVNLAAVATLPIAILLALSALLPYFRIGDSFSEYSYSVSGWAFLSTVDLLMVLGVLLSAMLLVAALVPEAREGRVTVTPGGEGNRAFGFPLVAVPAATVALLAALIFVLLVLRILFPPGGLSQGAGLLLGGFLAVALAGSAIGTIVIELAPTRPRNGFAPVGGPSAGTAEPFRIAGEGSPPPPAQPPPSAPPPSPPPGREPPPPNPGTRRG
jgi:hypothetical protein